MNKNILFGIIAVLIVASVAEGYFIFRERGEKNVLGAQLATLQQKTMKPSLAGGKRPAPMFVMKGQKFSDSPLFSKAYLIYPVNGSLSPDAQKALTGWTVNTAANSDGSTQVDLIPKEAEDVKQSFKVESGYKLYFIEMTLVDDATGVDENRGDDIGVLVDEKGMVQ